MEGVTAIRVPVEEAEKAWKEYRDAFRAKKEAFLHDLQVAYGHMKYGRSVIDVWDVMEKVGVDAKGYPRVAIAKAGTTQVFAFRPVWTSQTFDIMFKDRSTQPSWERANYRPELHGDVAIPRGTFRYPIETSTLKIWDGQNAIKAAVPVVPARLLPNGNLRSYHVLFEVEKWQPTIPPRRDPMLLKRINANTFAVMATWDMTDLERMILRGRLH